MDRSDYSREIDHIASVGSMTLKAPSADNVAVKIK